MRTLLENVYVKQMRYVVNILIIYRSPNNISHRYIIKLITRKLDKLGLEVISAFYGVLGEKVTPYMHI